MAVQELFDLARIDVLAAANHHVLQATDDVDVALVVHRGQIPGVHPAGGIDGVAGFFVVIPVAAHDRIAPGAEFAGGAAWHDTPLRIDDLHFNVRLHAAYGGHPPFKGVIDRALCGDRRRLGHAVSDGHLMHVHLRLHALHHFDRARRSGHDPGAQTRKVELRKLRMIQFGNEHRGHAVQARAALSLDGLQHAQRIEGIGRIHHGRAMRHASQVAHHHAEAVVKRHRNAQPVLFREPDRLGHIKAVVQDVLVRERGALRKTGGTRGELDIDRVVELQAAHQFGQLCLLRRPAARADVIKVQHARCARHTQPDHAAQMGQRLGLQCTRCAVRELGRQIVHDGQVIARLERRRQHQCFALDFVECVFQLGTPIRRVDVHQDQTGLGGGELSQRPL